MKKRRYLIKILIIIIGILIYYLYQMYNKIDIKNYASSNETKIERTYRRYK